MAGNRQCRRRHYDDHHHALSRAAFGAIDISKATLCPERKVAFFVAARGRFFRFRGWYVRFEPRERVCCESVGP